MRRFRPPSGGFLSDLTPGLAVEFGIEDVDLHNAQAAVRFKDHELALALGVPIREIHMMPRSEWLDWVAFFRVRDVKRNRGRDR